MIDYDELDEEMIQFEKDHPSKRSGGNSGNSDMLKKIVYALGAVAAILVVVLVVVLIRKNTLVKELNLDKENLTSELVALQGDYEALSTTNAEINDSLLVEKEKVEQLIEKLQKTEATNRAKIRQYEKETGTLRSIMKSYIKQIDSLNTLNTNLRNEASAARRDAQESRRQYEDLRSTTDKLSAKASAGAVVKARGFNMVAINASNKQTDRSSRTAKLKTCLSLIENLIADHGYRTIYIRIKGPDGVLLADSEDNVFTCEGQQMIYSASREVDYQGEEVDLSIYLNDIPQYTKGLYTVQVLTERSLIGTAQFMLR